MSRLAIGAASLVAATVAIAGAARAQAPALRVTEVAASDRFPVGCAPGAGCMVAEPGLAIVVLYVEAADGSDPGDYLRREAGSLALVAGGAVRSTPIVSGLREGRHFVAFAVPAGVTAYVLHVPGFAPLDVAIGATTVPAAPAIVQPAPAQAALPIAPPTAALPIAPAPPGIAAPAIAPSVEAGWPSPGAWGPDGSLNPRVETSLDYGWIGAAAGIFAASYLLPIVVAIVDRYDDSSCRLPEEAFAVVTPIAGPLLMTASAPSCYFGTTSTGGQQPMPWIFAGLASVGQVIGIVVGVYHVAVPRSEVRYEDRSVDVAIVGVPGSDVGLGIEIAF